MKITLKKLLKLSFIEFFIEKKSIGIFHKPGHQRGRYNVSDLHHASGDGVYLPSGAAHKHQGKSLTETVTIIFVEEI